MVGDDTAENLTTLCADCHRAEHEFQRSAPHSRRQLIAPVTHGLDEGRGAIAQPAIKLRGFFELLATLAGDGYKAAGKFRKASHVAPQLFKLRNREDIFLTFAPAFLDIF